MVALGNFFFRYRNALFPLAGLFVLLPSPRLLPSDTLALTLGLPIIVAGQALRALTIGLFYIKRGGRNRRVYAKGLVTEGVFAHCRNPLYLGNVLMVLGLGVAMNSWFFLIGGGVFFVFVYSAIVAAEEHYLRGRFGEGYGAYCRDVPRWGIRVRGLRETLQASRFHWRRLLVREYGTFYNWTAGLPVALYLRAYLRGSRTLAWRPSDGALLGVAAAAFLFWIVIRYLKKSKVLVAD